LVLLLVLGGAGMGHAIYRQQRNLYHAMALQGTSLQALAFREFLRLYTSEVVERLKNQGIRVTHDYASQDGAIPLPPTLTMAIGQAMIQDRPGAEIRFYSDFPWRTDGGPRDPFERDALTALRLNPEQPFYRFETRNDISVLRYAEANRMISAACVDCHNRYPDSSKRDWKVGDVLGVLEVIRPLDDEGPLGVAQARTELGNSFLVAAMLAGIGASGLAVLVVALRRRTAALRNSETRKKAIVEAAGDAVIALDDRGLVGEWNPAAEAMFGYSRTEMLGQPISRIVPERVRERHAAGSRRYLETGRPALPSWRSVELIGLRRNGSEFPVEVTLAADTAGRDAGPTGRWLLVGLVRDVSERVEREQALSRARQELELAVVRARELAVAAQGANRVKSEFLANMSHEIRTPMTAILGFADSLADELLSPQERREAVQTIRRSGEHLLQIINDILDLTKIEAGKLIVELVDCPTCSILAEVQSFMAPKAASKQLALGVEFLTPIPERIRTDPVRLRQILFNLVGNSLKFTESGGVRLVIRHVSEPVSALQLDIVDTGIGMTPEQASFIFSAFDQADASTTRRFGGTGLGLTISKRLANLLGGDVVLVETGPGLGTRFRATIPTGPLGGVTMLTNPRDAVGVQTHLPEPSDATCRPLRGRILLAEDGADNQRLIAHILRKAGADVTIVENGKLAVDRIVTAADAGEPFDLVLMDMQMPVMDGYAATRALRKAGRSLRIIALTAHAMEGEREKCLAAGCDDYMAKPIQRAKLIELIRRHLDATASSARLVSPVGQVLAPAFTIRGSRTGE
jgi:PAS domain S-box-containing protein